jgi:hypothetical protein
MLETYDPEARDSPITGLQWPSRSDTAHRPFGLMFDNLTSLQTQRSVVNAISCGAASGLGNMHEYISLVNARALVFVNSD